VIDVYDDGDMVHGRPASVSASGLAVPGRSTTRRRPAIRASVLGCPDAW